MKPQRPKTCWTSTWDLLSSVCTAEPQPGTFPAQCAPLDFNGQIEMPEDMPDRVPEDMPDRMPEDMSDRMPEDLPASNKMYTCHGGGDHTK